MIPYYVMAFLPIIFRFIRIKGLNEKQQLGKVLVIFFSILFLLVALRGLSVGNDTISYLYKFRIIQKTAWNHLWGLTTEPLFNYLTKIILLFTRDYQVYLVIIHAIIILPLAWLYVKESELPVVTMVLFMIQSNFSMLFSGIRQSLAISVGVIAFLFVRHKKWYFFLLCVAVAYLIHNSAAILLLLYPVYYLRITKNRLLIVIPLLLMVFIFNRQIFMFLKPLVEEIYDYNISYTGAYTMLVLLILFAAMAFLLPEESLVDADTNAMRNMLLLTLTIQIFASLHPLAMRMGYYFSVFIPILIPRILLKCERWRQVATLATYVMIVFFLIYFFIRTPTHNALNIYPYRFFWEG